MEGKKLRTGFVWAGGYAQKTRKIGFAIAKAENVSSEIVNAEVARLNQYIFEFLVKNKIQKTDVIRVEVPYTVSPFRFELGKMKVEVFRRVAEIGGVGQ